MFASKGPKESWWTAASRWPSGIVSIRRKACRVVRLESGRLITVLKRVATADALILCGSS